MAKETLIVNEDEMSEYSIFGWNFEKGTPEGKVVLSRDTDDPKIKKVFNQEMKYRSIKRKIKNLDVPEKPVPQKITGLDIVLILFTGFIWLVVIFLRKPKEEYYKQELKDYNRERQGLEDQLEDIRLSIQYQD